MANLNMAIAKTHRIANQLIGLQMTNGNIIAIVLSATQMVAGAILLSSSKFHGWGLLLLIPVAAMFISLAILIERLTVGGLMSIRDAIEELIKVSDEHYQESLGEKREVVFSHLKRRKGRAIGLIWAQAPIAVAGMLISAFIGDVFFAWVFSPMEEPMGTIAGYVCAAVISLTFVFSELYKRQTDKALASTIKDTEISKTLLTNEQENFNITLAMGSMTTINKDKKLQETVQAQILARIAPTLEENVNALFKQVSSEQQALLPSPVDRETEQRLLEERIITKITEVVAPVQAKVDELHAHTQQLALPAPRQETEPQDAVTTGEFTTASGEAQLLYKAVTGRSELVATLLHNQHAPLQAHVNYLAKELPDMTVSEQNVAEVLAILVKEEQDTDKLVSTGEIQQPQIPTIPAINESAFHLYETIRQAPGLAEKIWSYREKPLSDLADKLAQFFPDLQIDEVAVDQVLTLIHRDLQQQVAEIKPVSAPLQSSPQQGSAPRKQHLSGPRNVQVTGPLKKARTTQATGTRKKVKMDTPSVAPRTKWNPAVEAEMIGLVSENPDITNSTIEDRFGVTENTARAWKRKALDRIKQMQNA